MIMPSHIFHDVLDSLDLDLLQVVLGLLLEHVCSDLGASGL